MKTLRLNRAESIAYTAGERRFWRAMRKTRGGCVTISEYTPTPYGQPGDRIILAERNTCGTQATITAITVEQRGGRWGWVVEVGGGITPKPEPYVLENEEGIMGTEDDLLVFLSLEAAQRHADKYPAKKWKPRLLGVLGFTGVSR
jgi:hypothetical protein